MIAHAIAEFQEHPRVGTIHVVSDPCDHAELNRIFADRARWSKLAPLIAGGAERQDSVANGLDTLAADAPDWVLVHDGARPFCTARLIGRVLDTLDSAAAVVPVLPLHDTIRRSQGKRTRVADRSNLYRCQTPQGFHWPLLRDSYLRAAQSGFRGTDDAQLVEESGGTVRLIDGEPRNIKLTTQMDFRLGEWILANPDWGC